MESDSNDSEQDFDIGDLEQKLDNIDEQMKVYASYELYLEKIQLVKKMGNFDMVLETYKSFSQAFPLTADLWIDYIMISTSLEKDDSDDFILNLYSLAVKDYLSAKVWVAYINFAIQCQDDERRSNDWVRQIYEESLLLPALHVTKGLHVWKAALDFEKKIYEFFQEEEESPDKENKLKVQLQKVMDLYLRMFAVPLVGNNEELDKLKEWLKEMKLSPEISDIEKVFNDSENILTALMPHEKKLERCSDSDVFKYKVFPKYINYIEDVLKVPESQLVCLYERMVERLPLYPSVWIMYLEFMKKHNTGKLLSVARRSVRNCPYDVDLRVRYARFFEDVADNTEEVKGVYKEALEIPFDDPMHTLLIWKHYIYFLGLRLHNKENDCRSEMEQLFTGTATVMKQYFANHKSNPVNQLMLEWSKVCAEVLKDADAAREVWLTQILIDNNKCNGKLWCQYLQFEKQYGTPDKLREGYSCAMANVTKGAHLISKKWLEFEKENGNTEQLNEAINICEIRLQNLEVDDLKDDSKSSMTVPHKSQHQKNSSKRALEPSEKSSSESKSKKKDLKSGKWQNLGQQMSNTNTNSSSYSPASVDPNRTVFLSNLDFTVTEDMISSVFQQAGAVDHIKLKSDYKGQSKGFGYIVFQSEESVGKALKMDHTIIKERPVFVSKFNSDKSSRKHFFNYSTSEEKNKIFIRGLSFNTTKDKLNEIFSQHGTVKEVRLVMLRNGKPKGLAYVDFETEEMASRAVEATNGMELDTRKIFVAISQPTVNNQKPALTSTESEKPKVEEFARKSTTRLLIPSSVKIPLKKPKLDITTSISVDRNADSNSVNSSKGLSNADFRNMLLQKR